MWEHFVSRKALDIDGVGEKVTAALLDAGFVTTFDDLFTLEEGDFLELEGFAEISAKRAVDAIRAAANPPTGGVPLARLLTGLSIDHVGEETARDLAAHFGTLEKLRKATEEELIALDGIGEIVAHSVHAWFNEKKNLAMLDRLLKYIMLEKPALRRAQGKLKGKSFVFTGSLESMSREEAGERVRALGGSVASSVSKQTSYVVSGESSGSKLDKARSLGVTILSERDFLNLLNQ